MINFAGWELPVQYTSLKAEHLNTRKNVGLFDVSHMGEIRLRGSKALETAEWLTTNSVSALSAGRSQYTLLPNKNGGLVDDLLIYCVEFNADYLLCVNAANTQKVFTWIQENNRGAEVCNESDQWSQMAVQGPKAIRVMEEVFGIDLSNNPKIEQSPGSRPGGDQPTGAAGQRPAEPGSRPGGSQPTSKNSNNLSDNQKIEQSPGSRPGGDQPTGAAKQRPAEQSHLTTPFGFATLPFQEHSCLVARTGYTGEDGCEVFVPNQGAVTLWQAILEKGKKYQLQPVGLGARNTLRLEARLSLYGHEIDETTNPYAAGLGWTVKASEKDFIGKAEILRQKEQGFERKLVGFEGLEKGIPRQGYKVFSFDNKELGRVTSGTLSPSLDRPIGLAYVDGAQAEIGNEFFIEIRSRKMRAKVVKTPFVKRG